MKLFSTISCGTLIGTSFFVLINTNSNNFQKDYIGSLTTALLLIFMMIIVLGWCVVLAKEEVVLKHLKAFYKSNI